MSSPRLAADSFFILPSLDPCCRARANDPSPLPTLPTLTVGNEDHVLFHCLAQGDFPRSSNEWSGSGYVIASGSKNTDDASSKVRPCFLNFAAALQASHSNVTPPKFTAPFPHLPRQSASCSPGRPIVQSEVARNAQTVEPPRPPRRIPPLRQPRTLAGSCRGRGQDTTAISHHGVADRPTNRPIPNFTFPTIFNLYFLYSQRHPAPNPKLPPCHHAIF
jgi:hypothetical protein